jgi:peptidoglycan/xylan/chitin deacetylase (PgdA/CDA1 family)
MRRPLAAVAAVVVITSLLVGCGEKANERFAPIAKGQTVVSLEFDDGIDSQWQAREVLSARSLHATFFAISGSVASPGYLDWEQLKALASDGNEIGGHTVTHPHLAATTPDEVRREICSDRQTLVRHGFDVADFAYPYGSYSTATEQIAASCGYNSARAFNETSAGRCGTCADTERIPPVDAYATAGDFAVVDTTDLGTLQQAVTGAEAQGGGWTQIVFHHLCDHCDPFSTTPATLAAFLDWLAPRQASGTVVRTVRDVVRGPVRPVVAAPPVAPPVGASNALPNASLEADADGNGIPDCWSETGYGNADATWSRTADSHSGAAAVTLKVSSLSSGDRKLILAQDMGACSLTPAPGTSYHMSLSYRADVEPILVAFYRNADGRWDYWSESPPLPPSAGWRQATWTTPPAPRDAAGLSVGVLVKTAGSLTVDDLSLTVTSSP